MRIQLIKFGALCAAAIALIAIMGLADEPAFRILSGVLLAVPFGPMLLLVLRDTGQALRRAGLASPRAAFWGRLLGVPQALFGLVCFLVGIGILPLVLHKWWTTGEPPAGNWISGPIGFVVFGLVLMRWAFGVAPANTLESGADPQSR